MQQKHKRWLDDEVPYGGDGDDFPNDEDKKCDPKGDKESSEDEVETMSSEYIMKHERWRLHKLWLDVGGGGGTRLAPPTIAVRPTVWERRT
ncbi:unnamed protein product [Calypogeia fissa]